MTLTAIFALLCYCVYLHVRSVADREALKYLADQAGEVAGRVDVIQKYGVETLRAVGTEEP